MNVLSVFDGMSCGQIALERAGIEVENYFASETDKYAIQVARKNYPNTQHLGSIEGWKSWDLPKIDLLIGGSPCQGFSNAGLGLNFEDPRSKLFFTYVEILKDLKEKNPDLQFLLENVKMKKEWQKIISDLLGVEPVKINSALVSAQNRERLYWANWTITQPEDKGIFLKDIIEDQTEIAQGAALRNQVTKNGTEAQLNVRKDEKSNCVVPTYTAKLNGVAVKTIGHGYIKESVKDMDKYPSLCAQSPRSKHLILSGKRLENFTKNFPYRSEKKWVALSPEKALCMTSRQYANWYGTHVLQDDLSVRQLSPIECERLQTLPDNYTEGVSNTQRYKMLGNGWTVDVIVHILNSNPNLM